MKPFSPDGLTIRASSHEPKDTMDRFGAAVTERGMAVFARIDHTHAASQIGMELRPTEVLIFGNPRMGTPLMQAAQTLAIDLPLRALVWIDHAGTTWLAYNDPKWLATRHHLDPATAQTIDAMTHALATAAQAATD